MKSNISIYKNTNNNDGGGDDDDLTNEMLAS